MKRIVIVAGEQSGDIHGGRLLRSLRDLGYGGSFTGIGGPSMIAEGLESIAHIAEMNVVGFWEVAKRYGFFRRRLAEAEDLLDGADAFVAVDYPGFNMRLAQAAKRKGIPVIWYIAPQLWAWGKRRAAKLAACVDALLVVFPFEVEFFASLGIDTTFVGHPLLDDPAFEVISGGRDENLLAILPGSRPQEVQRHALLLARTVELVSKRDSALRCAVPTTGLVPASFYRPLTDSGAILHGNSRELMRQATAGLVKTGTSTLEAGLLGMPFASFYVASPLTYQIGKRLVTLPYLSLVNIVAGRRVVEELIQGAASPGVLADALLRLRDDASLRSSLAGDFAGIRATLGHSGASRNAALSVMRYLR